ncbi:PT domain-containing protein [Schumannella sp. 10F1B-5-1]|uniref:PT domain-containing protein n=1 Tax=Schumannella sp. 10F1B-5-1 TaxID=2590780 RepID=UPI001131DCA8|nr:PT domain-containing protein [Schumannella sp. 10F1B-5-1]TPW70721.1 hypothetical protein FJ658_11355 [Schumannella sp. 10F1B-5-1]
MSTSASGSTLEKDPNGEPPVAEVVDEKTETGTPWARLVAPSVEAGRLRRRMLGVSLLIVIPLGLFAIGSFVNAVIAQGAKNSYDQGDYLGSVGWARWGVSLNPIDPYLPHYNLGTAYGAADLLTESEKELTLAVQNAGSIQQLCPARANLALTEEKIGDRAMADGRPADAATAYATAQELWAQSQGDKCFDDQEFSDKQESSTDRLDEKQQEAQQQSGQDPQQGQGGQSGQPSGGASGQPSGQPSGGASGQPSGQPSGGASGQPSGQPSGGASRQPSGQPSDGTSGQPSDGSGSNDGTDDGDQSETLGDKLGQLKGRDEQAGRNRDQRGEESGSSNQRPAKPW